MKDDVPYDVKWHQKMGAVVRDGRIIAFQPCPSGKCWFRSNGRNYRVRLARKWNDEYKHFSYWCYRCGYEQGWL